MYSKGSKLVKSLLALTVVLVLSDVPAFSQKKKKDKKGKKIEKVDVRVAEANLIAAKREVILGNFDDAEELLFKVLDEDKKNGAAYYELARLTTKKGDWEDALKYINEAQSIDPDNKWYMIEYADLLAQTGRYEEGAKVYERLIKADPNNPDFYLDHAQLLTLTGEYKAAIATLDQLEKKIGVDQMISGEKQRLYMQINDVEGAAGEVEKLIEAFPSETSYYHLLGDIYLKNGMEDKALNIYKDLLKQNPNDPFARLAMAEHYRQSGDKEKGFEELKKAFASKDMPAEPKINIMVSNLGMQLEDEAKLQETKELAEILAQTHDDNAKVQAIYGDILMRSNDLEGAIPAFKKAVELDGSMMDVWNQLFFAESQLNYFQEMIYDSEKAIELFPNQSLMYYFNGIAHNRLRNYDKAVKSLKKATLIGSDNSGLMSDLYSQLGDAYNAQKEHKKSDEAFDKSIEFDPNNSMVLNNYSYYLSLRDEELEKAAEMSKRSNEIEPKNSSFQDTYGWILYRLQRFDEAKEWLEKAMSNGGAERPVILDHYGDILYRLKQVDEAVEYWQKAKSKGLSSEVIDRKIADRKVYE